MINKNQMVAVGGFLVFGAIALYLFGLSGMNEEFLSNIFSKTLAYSTTGNIALNMNYLLAAILLLPISFAFIAIYALSQERTDNIIHLAGLLMIPLSLLTIGMSYVGAAFGAGLFMAAFLLQYLPIDDAKAYKELRPGRIARAASGTVMLLLSTLVAASVFVTVSGDAKYANSGVNDMVSSIVELTVAKDTLNTVESIPGGMQTLTEQIKSSEVVKIIKTYYPLISAITAFSYLQVLGIIIAHLAGIYAWALWRMGGNESDTSAK